jgi:amylosucrase
MVLNNGSATSDSRQIAELALQRLRPKLEAIWKTNEVSAEDAEVFEQRLVRYWPQLFSKLFHLYGRSWDFYFHLEQTIEILTTGFLERSATLRAADEHRINYPDWYLSQQIVGGALYVDLFSENLGELRRQIPYFQKLGLTYLHLMPLFAVRPGDNDGGYAISNYRSIDPRIGTISDLQLLAEDLRAAGIVLVLDFVFNHTADDHSWAQKAQSGIREYQDFYYMFPDREVPDQYEQTLREIFPTVRRGNFTWHDRTERWVWTTFNSFQWDLNYSNPAVFNAMLGEMLFIANTGVDILRLDAVAFIWKQMGTGCENLPQAHTLIQAFNTCARIAAPGLLFKSEAIVHPDEVVKYIDRNECQLSYNPTLMALLWESLATRETKLLKKSLGKRHNLPERTMWVNYLRCHDDIGWTFDDDDAASVGINGFEHRRFLNEFYTGQFEGSFARGVPFQHNAETGDMRISGTMASLAGLEKAIDAGRDDWKELAIRRILLLNAAMMSIGGIPLIYLGEEWGVMNDYDFVRDPAKAGDTRWIHRPKMQWEFLKELNDDGSIRKRIFESLSKMIACRRETAGFAGMSMALIPLESSSLLGFVRQNEGNRVMVLANFSEQTQFVDPEKVRTAGMGRFFKDVITEREVGTSERLEMGPYDYLWLSRI